MITNVKLPAGKTPGIDVFCFGALQFGSNADGSVDVPDYIAKALVTAGGVCATNITATDSALLTACDPIELGYFIHTWGQDVGTNPYAAAPAEGEEPPAYDVRAHVQSLYADKGMPAGRIKEL